MKYDKKELIIRRISKDDLEIKLRLNDLVTRTVDTISEIFKYIFPECKIKCDNDMVFVYYKGYSRQMTMLNGRLNLISHYDGLEDIARKIMEVNLTIKEFINEIDKKLNEMMRIEL